MKFEKANKFSLDYYEAILRGAISHGYRFLTMRTFAQERPDVRAEKVCVLRHDLDDKPTRLRGMVECEEALNIRSTIFVLLHTDKYNLLSYPILTMLKAVEARGFEVGLHTNFVEVSQIVGVEPDKVLSNELKTLRLYFGVVGIACHRNIDFMYNSLPYVESNWENLRVHNNLRYQAYDKSVFGDLLFVNEGFLPHLGWRDDDPDAVIEEGRSFCLSTHPHWWYRDHAFEN